ncbi:MAG: FxsA family protein [Porticoccaceae bacterium]
MRLLLTVFIVMPILEMWVLISVGGHIGAINTICLVLLTAVVGIVLLRAQGFETLWRGREKLQKGQVPAQEMAEGIVLAVSGALLLTPGFVTDVVGFIGLVPVSRKVLIRALLHRLKITSISAAGRADFFGQANSQDGRETINGESWDVASESKRLDDK